MPWLQMTVTANRFAGTSREPLRTTGVDYLFGHGFQSFTIRPGLSLLPTAMFHDDALGLGFAAGHEYHFFVLCPQYPSIIKALMQVMTSCYPLPGFSFLSLSLSLSLFLLVFYIRPALPTNCCVIMGRTGLQ